MARRVVVCLAVVMNGPRRSSTARSSIPREWSGMNHVRNAVICSAMIAELLALMRLSQTARK